MFRPRWLKTLYSLGLEFWLPLPLLGLLFWVGSGLVTNKMLSHSSDTAAKIQVNGLKPKERSQKVLFIQVEINQNQGFSKVTVKTATTALKELQFEFPITEYTQVEAAIAQQLGLSPSQVRKLVRYRIQPQ